MTYPMVWLIGCCTIHHRKTVGNKGLARLFNVAWAVVVILEPTVMFLNPFPFDATLATLTAEEIRATPIAQECLVPFEAELVQRHVAGSSPFRSACFPYVLHKDDVLPVAREWWVARPVVS